MNAWYTIFSLIFFILAAIFFRFAWYQQDADILAFVAASMISLDIATVLTLLLWLLWRLLRLFYDYCFSVTFLAMTLTVVLHILHTIHWDPIITSDIVLLCMISGIHGVLRPYTLLWTRESIQQNIFILTQRTFRLSRSFFGFLVGLASIPPLLLYTMLRLTVRCVLTTPFYSKAIRFMWLFRCLLEHGNNLHHGSCPFELDIFGASLYNSDDDDFSDADEPLHHGRFPVELETWTMTNMRYLFSRNNRSNNNDGDDSSGVDDSFHTAAESELDSPETSGSFIGSNNSDSDGDDSSEKKAESNVPDEGTVATASNENAEIVDVGARTATVSSVKIDRDSPLSAGGVASHGVASVSDLQAPPPHGSNDYNRGIGNSDGTSNSDKSDNTVDRSILQEAAKDRNDDASSEDDNVDTGYVGGYDSDDDDGDDDDDNTDEFYFPSAASAPADEPETRPDTMAREDAVDKDKKGAPDSHLKPDSEKGVDNDSFNRALHETEGNNNNNDVVDNTNHDAVRTSRQQERSLLGSAPQQSPTSEAAGVGNYSASGKDATATTRSIDSTDATIDDSSRRGHVAGDDASTVPAIGVDEKAVGSKAKIQGNQTDDIGSEREEYGNVDSHILTFGGIMEEAVKALVVDEQDDQNELLDNIRSIDENDEEEHSILGPDDDDDDDDDDGNGVPHIPSEEHDRVAAISATTAPLDSAELVREFLPRLSGLRAEVDFRTGEEGDDVGSEAAVGNDTMEPNSGRQSEGAALTPFIPLRQTVSTPTTTTTTTAAHSTMDSATNMQQQAKKATTETPQHQPLQQLHTQYAEERENHIDGEEDQVHPRQGEEDSDEGVLDNDDEEEAQQDIVDDAHPPDSGEVLLDNNATDEEEEQRAGSPDVGRGDDSDEGVLDNGDEEEAQQYIVDDAHPPDSGEVLLDNNASNEEEEEADEDDEEEQHAGALDIGRGDAGNRRNQPSDSQSDSTPQSVECGCTKKRCLKLFCECFANGMPCNSRCGCRHCMNKDGLPARTNAVARAIAKNPRIFDVPVQRKRHARRVGNCTCKTGCGNGNCPCFKNGGCTENCVCGGACNNAPGRRNEGNAASTKN